LRTWKRGDWKALHAHCNTQEVMNWLGGVVTPRQVRREVDWYIRHQELRSHTFWLVERKRDHAFVGFCGLIRVAELGSPLLGQLEIGWRTRRDMWRRGYSSEAATAVLEWAALKLPGQTVFARINVHNEASAKLAERLGMRRVIGGDHTHPADRMRLATYALKSAKTAAKGG
jgi:RimJ/RimL family protein N-acetyltransferase